MKSQQYEAELLAAEKANRAKTELLASVSHEMRTPMNVIIGLDKIALSEPGISDTTKDHLEKIGRSADHMLGLINNILEMNQLDKTRGSEYDSDDGDRQRVFRDPREHGF
ncbi:MAG: hypothetical protein IKI91_03820, partial [Clostridia bacterium]|nr:hypothetical protein [Clostridia bacterium]